jgi:hypothetical protein
MAVEPAAPEGLLSKKHMISPSVWYGQTEQVAGKCTILAYK